MSSKIYYIVPDNIKPSWGLGVIYTHVRILLDHGFDAAIVHQKSPFKIKWLQINVPVLYWESKNFYLRKEDVLVVPEVMVGLKGLKKVDCTKVLFVQASSFLFDSLPPKVTHQELGFKGVIGIMPHMMPILQKYVQLPATMIPPFVADYCYKDPRQLHKRKNNILIFPKFQQQDYGIIHRIVSDKLASINKKGIWSRFSNDNWKLIEVKDKSHKEVAALMKEATFFISTNAFEAFNTSVAEAMAAGCINLCYEGFGPKDYLEDGKNAFVFQNNEAYALCEKLFTFLHNFEEMQEVFVALREHAYNTAGEYSVEKAKPAIADYFTNITK